MTLATKLVPTHPIRQPEMCRNKQILKLSQNQYCYPMQPVTLLFRKSQITSRPLNISDTIFFFQLVLNLAYFVIAPFKPLVTCLCFKGRDFKKYCFGSKNVESQRMERH